MSKEWDTDQLPASEEVKGGLSVSSGGSSSRNESTAALEERSLFGLDALAARKRREKGPRSAAKKRARASWKEDGDDELQQQRSDAVTSRSASAPTRPRFPQSSGRPQSRWGARQTTSQRPPRPKWNDSTVTRSASRNPVSGETRAAWGTEAAQAEYAAEEERAERDWYLGEDAERALPVVHDEAAVARRQARTLTAKAAARHADAARWEERQMGSGMYAARGARAADAAVDDEAGPRVTILVQELVPPFLRAEQKLLGDKLQHITESKSVVVGDRIVMPVKDPTSDLAIVARRGSPTVQEYREKKDRGAKRTKYWELGSAAGAKAKESAEKEEERAAADAAVAKSEEGDWKRDMQFGKALQKMRGENESKDEQLHEKDVNPTEEEQQSGDDEKKIQIPKSVEEVRRSLPVHGVRRELMNLIRDHQVVVVVGETGSGKTTQLTQYLHEEGYSRNGMIGCTQPRRVAAVSVAQRVAEEFQGGCKLGQEVGYSIRFEDCTSKSTVIKYMTDGILLRETLSDPDVDRYSVIVMDEAHERSLNTDVLFGVLRTVLSKRLDIKVIVTSATLNAEKFAQFFGGAPVFNIPGRTYPVDTFFSRTPVEDYVADAVFQVMQIHLKAPLPGDILVFMTGQEDIETTCESLADKLSRLENPRPLLILPIYSQLAADLQTKIFEPAPKGMRKVVVASNIAETSLTIDGISYVVDSGFCKLKTYNPRLGMDALLLCPAAQSSVNQRAGRAGRTGPGKCYRLFTAAAYSMEMLDSNVPEIQRTNLSHVVLLLKSLGVKDLLDFPFLDPPPAENILKSMLGLWLLGALGAQGELTQLGRRMSVFPLDPALSGMLFMGEQNGCLVESVTIVAMLSVPNVFVRPHGREEESDNARNKFFVPESDHLTLLHMYQSWRAAGSRADWCVKHFINAKGMRKAREVREQLLELAKAQKMAHTTCDDWDVIRRTVASAYYYQAARRKGIGEYINIRSGVVCGLHPTSAIYGTGLSPDYVVYHELIYTKKEYMSCVTAVEPQWLAEAGPLLYVLRQAGDVDLENVYALQKKRADAESSVLKVGGTGGGSSSSFLDDFEQRRSEPNSSSSRQTIAGFGKGFQKRSRRR